MARRSIKVARADIDAGKHINREMVKYAQATAKHNGSSFTEAAKVMRAEAEQVARDLGVSAVFVTVWAEGVLSRGG